MSFANTFISLDDVDISSLSAGKFLRVRPSGNVEISQYDITTDVLTDVETSGAYTPSVGQSLVYTAAGKWRPSTLDVYSAGNGINKSGLTLNVTAGTGGGLVSNTSGVFIADVTDADNVAATHGNASTVPQITVGRDGRITGVTEVAIEVARAQTLNANYIGTITGTSGQITVTNGAGAEDANATLNLVATGVTAGVYGNTTHAPRITVDTYGRISSVDTVEVSGSGSGGNASLGFANILISGQTTVSAEKVEDDLTIAAGTGMALTTSANADTISFAINPSTAAAAMSIANFSDVDTTGITNGQILVWNSSTNKFEAGAKGAGGGGNSNIALTDFSVTTASPSGNGSLTYDNAGVFTFTPANVSSGGGGTDSQDLTLAGNVISLTGQSGNVDLTALLASVNNDQQVLSLTGNVISLTNQSGNVDLTTLLGTYGGYGNTDVQTYLDAQGYSNTDSDSQTLSWNAGTTTLAVSGGNNVDLSALSQTLTINSSNVINISGSLDTVDLTNTLSVYQRIDAAATANTNMKAYVDAEINTLIGGANVNLDSLGEVANALANSNTELSTVAFTGAFSDVASRPTISLSGSDLTYDGTTVDLSGVGATGPQGPQGNTGATGNGITNAVVNSGNLLLTYSNTSTQNLGDIRGPQGATGNVGATGAAGDDGVSISSAALSGDNLQLTLSNSAVLTAGNVRGPIGPQGPTGATGPQGDGNAGVSSGSVNGSGNLILTLNDSSTVDVGNVKGDIGATGSTGPQGPAGNVLVTTANAAPGGAVEGQMWYATDDGHTYIYVDSSWVQANPGQDPQSLSIAGNVISLTGQSGNVDLTSTLAPYLKSETDSQDLSITGNVISLTGQSGNVDLTSLLATYNTDAQDLTLSGNTISLSGQSGNVDLTSLLGSYGGGISNVVEDTTPQLGGALDVNGQDIVSTSNGDIDLDPDGSGVVVFKGNATKGAGQFKLNCENNSHGITIKGPPHSAAASYTLTLPNDDGSADQVLKTDGSGVLSWVDQSGGGGGGTSITVQDEGSNLSTAASILNFAGAGVTATGTGATKTITIPGGSGVAVVQRFKLNYASNGNLNNTESLTSLISNVSIDSATGGDVTVNFDSSINYPPASVIVYGYDYTNNKYSVVPLETSMGLREIAGGGSAGSPTLFNGSSNISLKLRLRETETGASRSFGTTTHAWIQFVVYD